jgi:aspartate aminotransferase
MIRKMFEEGLVLKKLHGADKVFDFSLGNPDIEPPESFRRTLIELASERNPGMHGYMPNAGFAATRAALAEKTSREQSVKVPAQNIIMSCGAAGALNVVFRALLNPDDEIIVPSPYFPEYRWYITHHGGRFIDVPSAEDFSLDPRAISAALTPKTAAVLINSPHNPTGRLYSAESLRDLAAVLYAHEKKTGHLPYLIADEPYREVVYDGLVVPSVFAAYRNALVVTSYSKSLSLPGERIGFIAVRPDADDSELLLESLVFATRTLGFVNAPALMQRCVARLTEATVDVSVYARRRAAFIRVLDEAGISYSKPEGAFYLFARVPERRGSADDLAFADALKQELILAVPGSGFGAPGWMRFAYCVSEGVINASSTALKRVVEGWHCG